MFNEARLKLTGWYLVIIMLVSVMFSVAFYNSATREIQRVTRLQEIRAQNLNSNFQGPPESFFRPRTLLDLQDSRRRLALTLLLINGGIFIFAGGAAYFLSGQTLRPIKRMVDEQNRFVSDASHEMRTPLTSLRSEIEVELRNEKMTADEARRILESNLEEVVSLQTLSDNLLELSQFEKPQSTKMAEVSVPESLAQALKKLNGSIAKKKITINQKVQNVNAQGIPEQITQLLVILLDNAVKYSPIKGNVSILAKRTDGKVRIEISDNGVGISEEDLPHIFERFYRVNKSRSKQTPGYGLGLSIAKEIVAFHNGSISVKSKPGEQTTFMVILPA